MKTKILKSCVILQTLILIFSFTSCEHKKEYEHQKECEHVWQEATCKSPKTCTVCGLEEGTVSEHIWEEATCVAPKTCTVCGETIGNANSKAHDYLDDVCQLCGTIQLTLSNYEKYLDYSATVSPQYNSSMTLYTKVRCNFEVTGNSHYRYNDVIIKVREVHYGDFEDYADAMIGTEDSPYDEETLSIALNLAGNGSGSTYLYTNLNATDKYYRKYDIVCNYTLYEIVGISGTVTEY